MPIPIGLHMFFILCLLEKHPPLPDQILKGGFAQHIGKRPRVKVQDTAPVGRKAERTGQKYLKKVDRKNQ